MTKEMERMKEIEERKAALRKEIADGKADTERLSAIKQEADDLSAEQEELRSKIELNQALKPGALPQSRGGGVGGKNSSADEFARTGRTSMELFDREGRSLLVSTGNLVTPQGYGTEIGARETVLSSILDDVNAFDATGTGAWDFPYLDTEGEPNDTTEGNILTGSTGTFNHVHCEPATWDVLGELSGMIKKMTPIAYEEAVKKCAYTALRRKAKAKIVAGVMASEIVQKISSVPLDGDYVRKIFLGYGGAEELTGEAKLYLNKKDLITLGELQTKDGKPVYKITKIDSNNGTIENGGSTLVFSLCSDLPQGKQLYGNAQTIKMPMWGGYEISTDEGGEYFKKNLMGVRGLATANAVLAVKNGMQLIGQSILE